jgi:tRNA(fMet)-specific endonuclease VapC
MRFLLDTNAVIAVLNDPTGPLSRRLRSALPSDVGVSVIVMHELYFGACKSARREHNMAIVDGLRFEVLAYEPDDARHAGEIRALLARQGTPIGAYDVLIAGQARARGLVLVTRNTREFARVPGLSIEDWDAGASGVSSE